MAKKQGQVNKISDNSPPEFKGPGVEAKKAVNAIVTIRDGIAQRVIFDEHGKEIGVELPANDEAKDNEKQDPVA